MCARLHPEGPALWVELENRFPVGIVATLALPEGARWQSTVPLPLRMRVGAERALRATTLSPDGPGAGPLSLTLRYELGTPGAEHDEGVRYAAPFAGAPAVVSQAAEGPTHRGALRHAVDFALPEGTPVLAARAGTVVQQRDGFGPSEGVRADPRTGNFVVVAHQDGTLAYYGHLRAGLALRVGDDVEVGHRLGLSGRSGAASGPHLHFHVWRRGDDGGEETLAVRFEGSAPEGLGLRSGDTLPPGVEVPRL